MTDMENFWLNEADQEFAATTRRHRADRKIDALLGLAEIGRNVCFGGKGGGGSSQDPQIGAAALKQAQTGEDWLTFAKDQFAVGNDRQKTIDELTNQVTSEQLKTQQQTNQWAQEDRDRTKSVFQPMEDKFVETANNYATQEKQDQAAATAVADVRQQGRLSNEANARTMASMGVNPSSGKWNATSRAQDTLTGLSAAGAANNARQTVRDKGLQLQADAINMGKGLASSTASAYGLGLNAGNSAVGNTAAANQSWQGNNSIMGQGFSGAMQGYAGQASTLNQSWSNQIAANNASNASAGGMMSGIGSLAGAGLMVF